MIGKICGTGSYAPSNYWDNNDLAKMVDTSDEWIRERTGVVRRHISVDDTTVSMAVKASRAALENAGVKPEELDLIIVSTITSNKIIPCAACEVQKELGAVNATCFDMSAACSGFLFGYNAAQAYISSGMYQTVLLVGSEMLSQIVNWQDRSSCILFGDGAGAAVFRPAEGVLPPCITYSDGAKGQVLSCESRHQKGWEEKVKEGSTVVYMDGREVFKFAVKQEPAAIRKLMELTGEKLEDIDWFILHQANLRIIESVAKRLKVDMAKFPTNIHEYGNTSSASIAILLDEMNRKGMLKEGQKIVLSGFGAGLSWGASLLTW